MARVNIEECWWTDPRRSKLARILGDEDKADGVAVRMWRLAQEYWGRSYGLIPKPIFESLESSDALIKCGLAEVRECSVYVRGSNQHLSWLQEKREQAKEAGKKSAESRRKKSGTAQPKGKKSRKPVKPVEPNPNDSRTNAERNSNAPEPSGSYSYSGSSSVVEEAPKNYNATANFDSRFHPDASRYSDALKTLGVEGSVRSNFVEVLKRFEKFEEFRDWANALVSAVEKKGIGSEMEKTRYITAALKKEIGVL